MKSKNFLGQKRNKIFSIKKCVKKEEKEKHQKYSLSEISKLVLDIIKKEKIKTINGITECILKTLKPENDEKIQKNIQRRVYDSINIMNAAGLLQKNKQQIKYIPLKEKNKDENNFKKTNKLNFYEINAENSLKEKQLLEQEYLDKLKQLNVLRQILMVKYLKLQSYENKDNLNNNKEKNITTNFQNKFLVKGKKSEKNKKIDINKPFEEINTNKISKTIKLRTEKITPEFNKSHTRNNNNNEQFDIFRTKNINFKEMDNFIKIENDKINTRNNNINNNKINKSEDIVLDYLKKNNLYKSG